MPIITNFIKKNLLAIFATMLLLHLVGCKDFKNCISEETSLVKVKFQAMNQQGGGSTQIQDVKNLFDSIGVEGMQQALRNTLQNDSTVALPLNPNADTTTFVFYKTGSRPDTLTFSYGRVLFLLSPQCGAQQKYTQLDIARTTFPSVKVLNPNLNRLAKPNVEILL